MTCAEKERELGVSSEMEEKNGGERRTTQIESRIEDVDDVSLSNDGSVSLGEVLKIKGQRRRSVNVDLEMNRKPAELT